MISLRLWGETDSFRVKNIIIRVREALRPTRFFRRRIRIDANEEGGRFVERSEECSTSCWFTGDWTVVERTSDDPEGVSGVDWRKYHDCRVSQGLLFSNHCLLKLFIAVISQLLNLQIRRLCWAWEWPSRRSWTPPQPSLLLRLSSLVLYVSKACYPLGSQIT